MGVGRSALGGAPGEAGVCAAPRPMSDLGIRTEHVAWADGHARITRRLRQVIGLDCQSMPTSHAAVRHGVGWSKVRRAEHAFLAEWDRNRPRRRSRHLGADEIYRGKAQKFYTVLSDLDTDHPVRFGVESLNTTIKAVVRRARGMRHEAMLLLKLKWATARPIRSSKDLARFLQPQALHSNRRRTEFR